MSLVNHILKDEIDRPTIGLLICRSKNNVFAQYCLEGYNQPIAITAYEGIQILPENFNDTLPSIEELEAEIEKQWELSFSQISKMECRICKKINSIIFKNNKTAYNMINLNWP